METGIPEAPMETGIPDPPMETGIPEATMETGIPDPPMETGIIEVIVGPGKSPRGYYRGGSQAKRRRVKSSILLKLKVCLFVCLYSIGGYLA